MRSSTAVAAMSCFLQAATAQIYDPNRPVQIVNLINPLWALPNGENSTRGLGASVVNVDSTAITYAVSCDATAELIPGPTPISWYGFLLLSSQRVGSSPVFWYRNIEIIPLHADVLISIWETVGPQLFTQWDTSLHFTLSTSGFNDVASYEGDYTFLSTLAPTITGTFSLGIAAATTTGRTRQTGTTTDATWFPIPITAGEEKLAAAFSSLTRTLSIGRPTTTLPSVLATTTTSSGRQVDQTGVTETRSTQSEGENESGSSATQSNTGVSSASATPEPTATSMISTSLGTGESEGAATIPSVSSSTVADGAGRVNGEVGWFGAVMGGVLGVLVL
ncbi:uncharacterized protein RSE6_08176 [Rhynchosporium secalis]|uniref:Uncharacterized protein n=1 Tax=Rhynchosporium secalis TaxID=38038 RepID=A0A1E1MFW3_RHYSE|nr:uncharacterized protein RSE6_08176 [Rhynchosporium secalis]